MNKIKKMDGTSVRLGDPITTCKHDFAKDIANVTFTLPVNSDFKKVLITVNYLPTDPLNRISSTYKFDYLPNVDVNQYIQYVVNLYNNGVETYPPESCL